MGGGPDQYIHIYIYMYVYCSLHPEVSNRLPWASPELRPGWPGSSSISEREPRFLRRSPAPTGGERGTWAKAAVWPNMKEMGWFSDAIHGQKAFWTYKKNMLVLGCYGPKAFGRAKR